MRISNPTLITQTIQLQLTEAQANGNLATLAAGPITPGASDLAGLSDCVIKYADRSMYVGYGSGTSTGNNVENTSVGWEALANCNSGQRNTAFGTQALLYMTSGNYNVAIGGNTLAFCINGEFNVA